MLILYSNQRPLPANVIFDDTLRTVLPRELGNPVEIFSEYLDIEHFPSQKSAEVTAEFMRQKYVKSNVGAIVATGPDAIRFAFRFRDRMVPKAPVVYMSVTRETLATMEVPGNVVGWVMDLDPGPMLALAQSLHPQATRLVFVIGASDFDLVWERRLRDVAARLAKPMQVEFLTRLPTAEVVRRLRTLTANAIVFTPGFYRDGSGVVFTPRKSLEQMVSVSTAPIYAPFDTFLGVGVVGSYLATFEDQARQAGADVAKLLRGTAPASIPTGVLRNTLTLDWRQIQRWGIDESKLPPDSIVRFREPGVWDRYRWPIVGIAAALALQSLLIVALIVQRRNRRKAERVAQQQRLELAHALRLATVGEMTASISHEINQPLGAILSNAEAAEMLLDSESPSIEELRQILADIRRDDLRASEVILRIRALLQKHEVQKQTLELGALVADAVRQVRSEAARREATIDVQSGPLPLLVEGDRVQLQQLFLNLIINALDAMSQTPAVFRRVTLRVSPLDGRKVEVAVSDAGHGLDANTSGQLFVSFFTTKPKGLGLGLSIARTIAEAHGGRIRAENNPSFGATFLVTLPEAGAA